jgi:hypothetical protein
MAQCDRMRSGRKLSLKTAMFSKNAIVLNQDLPATLPAILEMALRHCQVVDQ